MTYAWNQPCAGFLFALAMAFVVAPARTARADVVTIGASKDATIYAGFVNNSNGGGQGLFAGTDGNSNVARGLIRFDIPSQLTGSTITGVQLTMNLGLVAGGANPDPTPRTIGLFHVSNDWGEGAAGSSSTGIGGSGSGFAAPAGDSTWNARFYDPASPVLWTTPGGDALTAASGSNVVGTSLGPYTWASSLMVSEVQGWLNAPSTNFGWLVRNGSESTARTARDFWTREASDASLRPSLQITYTPEPTGLAGVATILLCASGLRSRRRMQSRSWRAYATRCGIAVCVCRDSR